MPHCGVPEWLSGTECVWRCRRHWSHGFHPWVGKSPWRREWRPTPVFLPRKSCGQRGLAVYIHCKELDRTWWLSLHTCERHKINVLIYFFLCGYPVVVAPLVEKTVFAPLCFLFFFVKNQLYLWKSILGLSILFHWFVYLFFCQYHNVFDYSSYIVKPWNQVLLLIVLFVLSKWYWLVCVCCLSI